MSLLLDHGHPEAWDYPIGMVWEEAQLVVERVNNQMASQAVLIHAAMLSASGFAGRKAGENFRNIIKNMTEE